MVIFEDTRNQIGEHKNIEAYCKQQGIEIVRQALCVGDYQISNRGDIVVDTKSGVRELAMEAGVNPNTMQRALTQLEQEGLLYTQRTSGRFVTEDKQVLKEMRKSLSEQYVKDLFEALGKIGMNREEIIEAVSSFESTDEKEA